MSKIQPLMTKLVDAITTTHQVEKVILFGSRARGDAEERSDIDIAIVCPDISVREWLDICDRIEMMDTLLEVNIVRFDTASKEFQERILQEGEVLYEQH